MELKERMYHIGLSKKDIKNAKYAILPGDPGRVSKIAEELENSVPLAVNREYTSYLGQIYGENILVISTGMGGPSTAICIEELAQLGILYLIRVGTCGGMQLDVHAGDIVVASAAIRQEGTSKEYLPIEFPAVSDLKLTYALYETAIKINPRTHLGVVHCKDSFYGQHNPERMPVGYELENKWKAWIKGGALASEMETASLYTVASTLNLHATAILSVVWNQERENNGVENKTVQDTTQEIRIVIETLKTLISDSKE